MPGTLKKKTDGILWLSFLEPYKLLELVVVDVDVLNLQFFRLLVVSFARSPHVFLLLPCASL